MTQLCRLADWVVPPQPARAAPAGRPGAVRGDHGRLRICADLDAEVAALARVTPDGRREVLGFDGGDSEDWALAAQTVALPTQVLAQPNRGQARTDLGGAMALLRGQPIEHDREGAKTELKTA